MASDDFVLIWAGNRSLLRAGTVLTFGDTPTDFDVRVNGEYARLRFEFPLDDGAMRAEYSTDLGTRQAPAGGLEIPVVYFKFFNLTGASTFTDGPVRVGTVGNVGLWIAYEVTPAVGSRHVKKIQYSLWQAPDNDEAGSLLAGGQGGL
jgi:hypothetical protein